ncbi:MAG: 30S ribosomal protein S8 [Deltaproteobacteria bacterium RIFOXYA12_FULL_58_15]|nr:MAG: 30S ribosomal protein S8 [Deltaproteobacteria bacterium RIFOXYA12_FULL_58_15]OGR15332.1 MAG: 30S ribosomal protein S8 [Deltaproteobacteria bacterium RIFOXYB12_FULL_58_9]
MYSDPVADMLTRIRNGCRARLERVDIPHSKLKKEIADILKSEGYITDYRVISDKSQGVLEVKLRYDHGRDSVITGIQRLSRPGRRRYHGSEEIPMIRNGQGVLIMTTSKGLMTDRDARKAHVGGEALCAVW